MRSIVDGNESIWFAFSDPIYAVCNDVIDVTCGDGEIRWHILNSMIIVGTRLDGWPIELLDDGLWSAQYDSISRYDECLD